MEELGINLVNIAIYSMLFFVMWLAIHKLLIVKLMKVVGEREESLKKGEQMYIQADSALTLGQKKQEDLLENAKKEALMIVELARKEGDKEKGIILSDAKKKAKEIIFEAEDVRRAKIEEEKKDFEKLLEERVNEKIESMARQGLIDVNLEKVVDKI
ncbi:MAG: hypothetical protein AAB443_00715 [Patescibacteria group bacterium]